MIPTPDRVGAAVLKRLRAMSFVENDNTMTAPVERDALSRVRRLAAETDLQARGYRLPD